MANIVIEGTRKIIVPEEYLELGVESDEKVKRLYFTIPRYVDNNHIDVLNERAHIYINYTNGRREVGSYLVDDAQISETSEDIVDFSWLLTRNTTTYKGIVRYIVCVKLSDENGDILYEWNTEIAKGTVKKGIETSTILDPYPDIVEQILSSLTTLSLEKQDILVAGKGISIENDIISTYTGVPSNIIKKYEYMYETNYDDLDYTYAKKYFKSKEDIPIPLGFCSSICNNGIFGRNYDWSYDNSATFVINTKKTFNRKQTLSVCGGITELTNTFVDSGEYSELYRVLPFYALDGINENGLVCSTNVVPNDYNEGITKSIPLIEEKEELNALMVVRYMLDNFSTATAAVEYIRDYVSIYFPKKLEEMNYELHWLIADATTSYVLEFINGTPVVINSKWMTNFNLYNVTPNDDGSVYTPVDVLDGNLPSQNGITSHGSGLERYNLINSNISTTLNVVDMKILLHDLFYTRAYSSSFNPSDPYWYTEFVGGTLTVDSLPSDFSEIVAKADEYYRNRVRGDGKTWQTVHSSVYDIESLTIYLNTNERDIEEVYTATIEKTEIITDYSELTNKPKINGVTLNGNKTTSDLGIEIPTNTSDLINDSGFITEDYHDDTKADKTELPTKVSDLENDSGFITEDYHDDTKADDSRVDVIATQVNTNTNTISALGEALNTKANISDIPTKTSDLDNDSGFITEDYHDNTKVDKVAGKGLSTNDLTDTLKSTYDSKADSEDIPTKLSDLDNDSGFITEDYHDESKQNKLTAGENITIENDVISASGDLAVDYSKATNKPSINGVTLNGNKTTSDLGIEIPTNTSDLVNDSGFINKDVDDLTNYYTKSQSNTLLLEKVDKEANKGLSTNDYTTAEKTKLASIQNGAEENVQSDWNQTNSTADDYIKNKPTIPSKTSDLTNDSDFIDSTYHDDTKADDSRVDTLSAQVSTNTSSIAAINTTLTTKADKSELPTKVSDLENDSGFITDDDLADLEADVSEIQGKIPSQATSTNKLADKEFVNSSIATNTAYFKGTYNSVAELPTTGVTNNDYAFVVVYDPVEPTEVKQYNRYKYSSDTSSWSFEYTLNNSTFTAEQWSAINSGVTSSTVSQVATNTINIASKADKSELPTKVSDLTNDSGFITSSYHDSTKADKTELPTKTSDLVNDSGFIDNTHHDDSKQNKLTVGDNITITNDTISATDTTYELATASTAGLMLTAQNKMIALTEEEFNALSVKANDTIYFVKE